MAIARTLSGLPPYGPEATAFPAEWGRLGREGAVVEFKSETGSWVGNFQPGIAGLDFVADHPDRRHVVVISAGDLWVVDPVERTAVCLLPAIVSAREVKNPVGWVFSRQDIALARLGPSGLIWHTRRISWDGFKDIAVGDSEVRGLAWSPDNSWIPFRVDLATGQSTGGSFGEEDSEEWEVLGSE